jgi:hypothetical protein
MTDRGSYVSSSGSSTSIYGYDTTDRHHVTTMTKPMDRRCSNPGMESSLDTTATVSTAAAVSSSSASGNGSRHRNMQTDPSMASLQLNFSSRSNKHSTNSNNYSGNSFCFSSNVGSCNQFTLNDSYASFAVSQPQLAWTSSHGTTNSNHMNASFGRNENTNIVCVNPAKMSLRPSVFTTLSGTRYYMDDSKGEPIPVPLSINPDVARRRSSDMSSQRTSSSSSLPMRDDSVRSQHGLSINSVSRQHCIQDNNNNNNHMPYPPQSRRHTMEGINGGLSYNNPTPKNRRGSASGQMFTLQNISEESTVPNMGHDLAPSLPPINHHFHPPIPTPNASQQMQQVFHPNSSQQHWHHNQDRNHHSSTNTHPQPDKQQYTHQRRSTTRSALKSLVMLDRIPPPLPPLPPLMKGIEMNCTQDIVSASDTRRSKQRPPLRLLPPNMNSTHNKSNAICPSITTTSAIMVGILFTDYGNQSSSIPYHAFTIPCQQCRCVMIVSKYCIVVQCPKCHVMAPCELSSSSSSLNQANKNSIRQRYEDRNQYRR